MTKPRLNFQLSVALFLLLCAASVDFLVLSVRADSAAVASSNAAVVPAKTDSHLSPEGLSQRVQDALDKIRPSLVTIQGASEWPSHPVLPPWLPEFSNGDFNTFNDLTLFPPLLRTATDRSGVATGVIVSADGFVWTSHHIVRGLDSVTVTLQDHTSYEGKVILSDPESGLGILKIDAQRLPAVKFGETANLKPADWAIAVALDDRHQPNLAAGMISSFKRANSESDIRMIRCSFPVDADFVGCAIVNLDGELIGINAATPSMRGSSFTACYALDSVAAKELHQKKTETTPISDRDAIQSKVYRPAAASGESTQTGKEGKLRQFEMFGRLFSAPGSKWTPGSLTSSVRNWFDSWQDAGHPLPHSVTNASESR